MYKIFVRPVLFLLKPEKIHDLLIKLLKKIQYFKFVLYGIYRLYSYKNELNTDVFGIKFKNPIGLAAGLDKNAEVIDSFTAFGFSHIEIGTVTPKAQPGNDKPRLFRIIKDKAIINRMGFNNLGVEQAIINIKKSKQKTIIGGNIGKNKITPNNEAINDYIACFNALHPYVDYFVINVSSPNTPNLRELQDKKPLKHILLTIKKLSLEKEIKKPVLLKIAPDLTNTQIDDIIEIVEQCNIDGIVATNTTISRDKLTIDDDEIQKIGKGGLSGKPLTKRSTEIIKYIHEKTKGRIPIIGVGGIMSVEDALDKINAGASLIQLYTGFIYEGPALIKKINKALIARKKQK